MDLPHIVKYLKDRDPVDINESYIIKQLERIKPKSCDDTFPGTGKGVREEIDLVGQFVNSTINSVIENHSTVSHKLLVTASSVLRAIAQQPQNAIHFDSVAVLLPVLQVVDGLTNWTIEDLFKLNAGVEILELANIVMTLSSCGRNVPVVPMYRLCCKLFNAERSGQYGNELNMAALRFYGNLSCSMAHYESICEQCRRSLPKLKMGDLHNINTLSALMLKCSQWSSAEVDRFATVEANCFASIFNSANSNDAGLAFTDALECLCILYSFPTNTLSQVTPVLEQNAGKLVQCLIDKMKECEESYHVIKHYTVLTSILDLRQPSISQLQRVQLCEVLSSSELMNCIKADCVGLATTPPHMSPLLVAATNLARVIVSLLIKEAKMSSDILVGFLTIIDDTAAAIPMVMDWSSSNHHEHCAAVHAQTLLNITEIIHNLVSCNLIKLDEVCIKLAHSSVVEKAFHFLMDAGSNSTESARLCQSTLNLLVVIAELDALEPRNQVGDYLTAVDNVIAKCNIAKKVIDFGRRGMFKENDVIVQTLLKLSNFDHFQSVTCKNMFASTFDVLCHSDANNMESNVAVNLLTDKEAVIRLQKDLDGMCDSVSRITVGASSQPEGPTADSDMVHLINMLSDKCQVATSYIDGKTEQCQQVAQCLNMALQDNTQAQKGRRQAEQEVVRLAAKLAKVMQDKKKCEESARVDIDNLERSLQREMQNYQDLEKAVKRMSELRKDEYNQYESTMTDLKQELSNMQQSLTLAEKKRVAVNAENERLQKFESHCKNLERELGDLKETYSLLQAQHGELQEKCNAQKEKYQEVWNSCKAYEKQLEEKEDAAKSLQQSITEQSAEMDAAQKTMEKLQKKLASEDEKKRMREKKMSALEATVKEKENEIKDMRQTIERYNKINELCNNVITGKIDVDKFSAK